MSDEQERIKHELVQYQSLTFVMRKIVGRVHARVTQLFETAVEAVKLPLKNLELCAGSFVAMQNLLQQVTEIAENSHLSHLSQAESGKSIKKSFLDKTNVDASAEFLTVAKPAHFRTRTCSIKDEMEVKNFAERNLNRRLLHALKSADISDPYLLLHQAKTSIGQLLRDVSQTKRDVDGYVDNTLEEFNCLNKEKKKRSTAQARKSSSFESFSVDNT